MNMNTFLVSTHPSEIIASLGRLGTCRFHLLVPDFQISDTNLPKWLGTSLVSAHKQHIVISGLCATLSKCLLHDSYRWSWCGNLTFWDLLQLGQQLCQFLLPIGQFPTPTEVHTEQGHDGIYNLEYEHKTEMSVMMDWTGAKKTELHC